MTVRRSAGTAAWLLGLALASAAARAGAATLTDDEALCQLRAVGGARVLVGARLSCIRQCAREALAGRVPLTDCQPPFAGGTARCVARRDADARARLNARSCGQDCPECYAGGDCPAAATSTVARIGSTIDALAPLVYCDDTASADGLTRREQACADHVAAELRRGALARFACLRACRRRVAAAALPPTACDTPLATNPTADTATAACLARAASRSVEHIDGTCQFDGAALECHAGRTGAQWVALVEGVVDAEATTLLCGSPMGAFLDDAR